MASKIKVDQLETADGSGTIALQNQLSGMTSASMPTGSVLQVVQFVKTDTAAFSGNQYQDHELGIEVTITPTSSSSKILITGHVSVGHSVATAGFAVGLYRGNTLIGAGDAAGAGVAASRAIDGNDHRADALRRPSRPGQGSAVSRGGLDPCRSSSAHRLGDFGTAGPGDLGLAADQRRGSQDSVERRLACR